jgi:hypothetical protein
MGYAVPQPFPRKRALPGDAFAGMILGVPYVFAVLAVGAPELELENTDP